MISFTKKPTLAQSLIASNLKQNQTSKQIQASEEMRMHSIDVRTIEPRSAPPRVRSE